MIEGDLGTMPLTDLLQWADASRAAGVLIVQQGPSEVRLRVRDRHVVSVSAPATDLSQVQELSPVAKPGLLSREGAARERVLDLFLEMEGRFRFVPGENPDAEKPDEEKPAEENPDKAGREERRDEIPVRLPLGWVALEGARICDEWPRVLASFPTSGARIEGMGAEPLRTLPAAAEALRALARGRPTLAEARMALGLSTAALLRQADLLCNLGLARVDGAKPGPDPAAKILRQLETLLDEEQYDEAAHVVEAMLAADPRDQLLRDLKVAIEQRHRDALYRELGASQVVKKTGAKGARLSSVEEHVLALVDGVGSVQGIVDRSALREVVTLRSLVRLGQRGVVRVG